MLAVSRPISLVSLFSGILVLLLLTGCGSPSETFEKPAAVPETTGEVQVRQIWSHRVARGHDGQFLFLRPAVKGDVVYTATADGYVTAYNARNGRRIWWVQVGERLLGGVGVDDSHLYVTSRSGHLMALSPEDGEEIWRAAMPNEVLSPPQSNNALVVVQTIDSKLIAYNADSGERRWQYDGNAPVLSYRGTATPYVDDGWVVTGFDNGRVVALDVNSGRLQWQYGVSTPTGRTELERLVDVDGSPVVRNGEVFVTGYRGRVAALDLLTGGEQWSRPVSSLQSPSVVGDNVFVAASDGQLIGFNRLSRTEVWRNNSLEWRRLTAPISLGEYLLVGDYEGYLYAVHPSDGRIAGRAVADPRGLRSEMVRYRDRVILFGNGGHLASYRIVKN